MNLYRNPFGSNQISKTCNNYEVRKWIYLLIYPPCVKVWHEAVLRTPGDKNSLDVTFPSEFELMTMLTDTKINPAS